jgi:hypothetical protein
MALELHLPAGLQHVPNRLPVHVCSTSGPHRPSVLIARPVWVGVGVDDVA